MYVCIYNVFFILYFICMDDNLMNKFSPILHEVRSLLFLLLCFILETSWPVSLQPVPSLFLYHHRSTRVTVPHLAFYMHSRNQTEVLGIDCSASTFIP